MSNRFLFFLSLVCAIVLISAGGMWFYQNSNKNITIASKNKGDSTSLQLTKDAISTPIEFHGPRFGPTDVPNEYGFWSFAIVKEGKLSRSGQPNLTDFKYLKKSGYKTIVNLRYPNEYDEISNDMEMPGVKEMGFTYVELPIPDGGIPTIEQANRFLAVVRDESYGKVHVHCRGGYGRTGLMTALYRFEIDKWPMDKAIEESRLFEGGVDETQRDWLLKWADDK